MRVKPVKLDKVRLMDVEVGEPFFFNHLRYVKLAEDSVVYAVPALSISSIATVDITERLDIPVEKKIVDAYFESVRKYVDTNIVKINLPDADIFRKYKTYINKEISDCWYVDNGEEDVLKGDEFMFIDDLNNLRTGSSSNAVTRQITETLNVRVVSYIEPFAEVFVAIK